MWGDDISSFLGQCMRGSGCKDISLWLGADDSDLENICSLEGAYLADSHVALIS